MRPSSPARLGPSLARTLFITAAGALALALVAASSSGCKKDSAKEAPGGKPITAATTDALWAFAPPAPDLAIVVADGALAPLHGGALRLLSDLEKAPGGAPIAAKVRIKAAGVPINPLDAAALAGAGIDLSRGVALFESSAGKLAVLPVSDPKKLLAKVGGTSEGGLDRLGSVLCKTAGDRYVCASSRELLDGAGKGKEGAALVAAWPKAMRGQLEIFVSHKELDLTEALDAPQGLRMSAQIERGAFTARVHMIGVPKGPMASARGARSPLLTGLADQHPVGLLVLSAAGPWKEAQAKAMADAAGAPPLPGGVAVSDLIGSLTGELVGHALPGTPQRGKIRIGLSSEIPFRKLLAACSQMAAGAPPGLKLEQKGDRCAVTADLSHFAGLPTMPPLSAELWVEKGAFVIGLGDQAAASDAGPAPTPFAREILDGSWLLALWGRGSLSPPATPAQVGAQLAAMRAQDPTGGLALWAAYHIGEFGLAVRVADDGIHAALRVRTLWANPDEVVTAVQAKIAEALAGDADALAGIAELAKKHPDTPLARDVEAGMTGLLTSAGAIGIVAAVAIPTFVRYQEKSREAELRYQMEALRRAREIEALEREAKALEGAPPSGIGAAPTPSGPGKPGPQQATPPAP